METPGTPPEPDLDSVLVLLFGQQWASAPPDGAVPGALVPGAGGRAPSGYGLEVVAQLILGWASAPSAPADPHPEPVRGRPDGTQKLAGIDRPPSVGRRDRRTRSFLRTSSTPPPGSGHRIRPGAPPTSTARVRIGRPHTIKYRNPG
ncbi:MAG: hypothetical protein ACYDFT_05235 [Thermoplasmata archaeon]